jgi:hypothetical protein
MRKKPIAQDDDMRPEYDFANMTGGVRGKYCKAYRQGFTVKIHNTDGTTDVRYFPPSASDKPLTDDQL